MSTDTQIECEYENSRVELVFENPKTGHFAYIENERLQFESHWDTSVYEVFGRPTPQGMELVAIHYDNPKEIDDDPDRVSFDVLKEEVAKENEKIK